MLALMNGKSFGKNACLAINNRFNFYFVRKVWFCHACVMNSRSPEEPWKCISFFFFKTNPIANLFPNKNTQVSIFFSCLCSLHYTRSQVLNCLANLQSSSNIQMKMKVGVHCPACTFVSWNLYVLAYKWLHLERLDDHNLISYVDVKLHFSPSCDLLLISSFLLSAVLLNVYLTKL